MGFSVEVIQVVQHMASCTEPPCKWVGPLRDRHAQAEDDAAKHVSLHHEWWTKYNQAIEYLHEQGDYDTVVEYYDDLTYPASPRSYTPYTGDSPRFDYSAMDRAMADAGLDTGLEG